MIAVTERPDRAPCMGCGVTVLWVETERGAKLCLDVEPTLQGNVILRHGPGLEDLVAHVETKKESEDRRASPIEAARVAFVPHWGTCPQAARFKRSKTKAEGSKPA